jgi:hypothetical protein
VRNEANREVCGAAAIRGCGTKPIRRGGGRGKTAWATGVERSQSHFRTVRQSGNPFCFQYRTGVERFERMCMNRLAEIVVTDGRNSSNVADFEAVAVNVRNRGVIGNADQHPSLQDALQLLPASFRGFGIRPDARDGGNVAIERPVIPVEPILLGHTRLPSASRWNAEPCLLLCPVSCKLRLG